MNLHAHSLPSSAPYLMKLTWREMKHLCPGNWKRPWSSDERTGGLLGLLGLLACIWVLLLIAASRGSVTVVQPYCGVR